jgi:hypothetical protein
LLLTSAQARWACTVWQSSAATGSPELVELR